MFLLRLFPAIYLFIHHEGSQGSLEDVMRTEVAIDSNLFERIFEAFFEDQESVTVFNLQSDNEKINLLKSLQKSCPLIVYDKINLELAKNISDMGRELDNPSVTKSYLIASRKTEIQLDSMAQINANGRWILFLFDAPLEEIRKIMIEMWSKHGMINLLSLTVHNDQCFVLSYNPFIKNGTKQGVIWERSIQEHVIPEIIGFCRKMLKNKISDLQGYTLRCSMFPAESSASPVYDDNKRLVRYKDVDGEIISMFSKSLKAKIEYVLPSDGFEMGFISPNGSFNGAIGEVEYGRVDFAGNSRLLIYTGTNNSAYLYPVEFINLRYMVPKNYPEEKKLKFTLLQMFDMKVSLIFLGVFFFTIAIWVIMNKVQVTSNNSDRLSFIEIALLTTSVLSYVAIPDRLFRRDSNRIILAFILMFAIIICNTFQGDITSYLSSPGKSTDIRTLDELLNSNLKLIALVVIKDLFKPNADQSNVNEIQKKLYRRQTVDPSKLLELIKDLGQKRLKAALLARENFGMNARYSFYDNETGEDTIHLVEEIPIMFYASYIVHKRSPFISKFNEVIHIAQEAGLVQHSIKSALYKQSLQRLTRYRKGLIKDKKIQVLTMQHVKDVFVFWSMSISICFLVFLFEKFIFRLKSKPIRSVTLRKLSANSSLSRRVLPFRH